MSKKEKRRSGRNRRLRLRMFDAGNTKCPICLTGFSRSEVEVGEATLEHAPPESLKGSAVCLTCRRCNNNASRVDHQAFLAKKAIDEWSSGQGARVEIEFLGINKSSRFISSDPKSALPTRVSHLRKGTIKIGALPSIDHLNINKGIRFRIQRSPQYEFVSMIKSAYLTVFSLMGEGGNMFAESVALKPVREQIMNPEKRILKGCFVVHGTVPETTELNKQLVFLCHAAHPPAWLIPMWNGNFVLLPCGGPEPIDEFLASDDEIRIENKHLAGWTTCRFNESLRITGSVSKESGISDGTLVGTTGLVPTGRGEWEWMVVDHHMQQYVALPFRPANENSHSDSLNVVEMLSSGAVEGRGLNKSALTRIGLGDWSKDLTIYGKTEKTSSLPKNKEGGDNKNEV